MTVDITEYKAIDLTKEKLIELIIQGESFKIMNIKDMSIVVRLVEQAIEGIGLTCRIYTECRAMVMTVSLIPTGVTQAIGLASAIGIGLHNLVTYDPDYEIAKNTIGSSITVINKNF